VSPSAVRPGSPFAPTGSSPLGMRPAPATMSPIEAALAGSAGSSAQTPAGATSADAAPASCPRCGKHVDPSLPFCGHCGTRVGDVGSTSRCESCGATYTKGVDVYCARCGTRVGDRSQKDTTNPFGSAAVGARKRGPGPRLSLLNDEGNPTSSYTLDRGDAVIGRGDADLRFEDVYLSPMHARFEMRDGELWIRDLGSRNGTWCFIDQPTRLTDGDVMLVGSQLVRFRRLGYPGPHPPEADATRRMGSLVPSADVAVLEQLRADGSVRDSFHLSPARTVLLGRESGDWVFPYDPTMSGRHAEVRSQDAEFFVHDAGSRNGVALAVRGDRMVKRGQRILVGDQILRVESV